jgi:predicted dehydrogenase
MNGSPRHEGGKVRIGILGAGMISTVKYGILPNLGDLSDRVEVVAIASRTQERAQKVAEAFGIPSVFPTLTAMLDGADLDAVVNLTPIPVHYETSMQILGAGKHLVTEKPLASSLAEANDICALADQEGLVVVTAPIDMLASEWVLARDLVREGAIGQVAFARVQSSHGGPAAMSWPVDPTWFYQEGAGPLLDMGVYGIHRVTGVLGSAKRVVALSGITAPTRVARGGPFDGIEISVTEDDNTLVMLDFGASTFAVVDATFNVIASKSALMELYGLAGSMLVDRPGSPTPVELFRLEAAPGLAGWIAPTDVGLAPAPDRTKQLFRGVLVEHLLDCLATGNPPVLSAQHSRHALEIMLAARQSAREGIAVDLTTTFSP